MDIVLKGEPLFIMDDRGNCLLKIHAYEHVDGTGMYVHAYEADDKGRTGELWDRKKKW